MHFYCFFITHKQTDVSRSTVAVPRNESLTASELVRTSAASGTGKPSVPTHAAAPRLGNPPPSPPRRRRQSPREPSNRRWAASHARRVSAPTPDSMPHACAPLIRIPAPALLGRAGSHAGRRPARAATLFRVLRPMRSAREQREKLTSGDFYNHVRLRFLPCRHARAACDSRGARHATGAGLRV